VTLTTAVMIAGAAMFGVLALVFLGRERLGGGDWEFDQRSDSPVVDLGTWLMAPPCDVSEDVPPPAPVRNTDWMRSWARPAAAPPPVSAGPGPLNVYVSRRAIDEMLAEAERITRSARPRK
jgi:hypothetical protein